MPQAPDSRRPLIAGPSEGPADPFPIRLSGPIVKGFGRGSADLGIPTANIPLEGLSVGGHENVESGIYFGWCGINVDNDGNAQHPTADDRTAKPNGTIWQMVMSIGWNPFYGNKIRSVEVHVMQHFKHDFYGARMNLIILGFIRPEYDYVSKEKLIEDIRFDIKVAERSLQRTVYERYKSEKYLLEFDGEGHDNEVAS